MIDKPSVVTHTSLVDLVLGISVSTHHDIYPFDTLSYESHKFSNSRSSLERATSEQTVIFTMRISPHLK